MLAPTKGMCRAFDIDPAEAPEKVYGMSGVVTEHAQMYDHLSGIENLVLYGTLFCMSKASSENKAVELLEKLGLIKATDKKLGVYSTDMRQRLKLFL